MLQYKFLLLGFCFIIAQPILTMEEDDDCFQKVKIEIIKQNKKDKKLSKKNKKKDGQAFFEQIKSDTESQIQLLTEPIQIEANQKILNLINENKETIQKASPEEKVVINNLLQQAFFSEIEDDRAMVEVLTFVTSGIFNGMKNRGQSWLTLKAPLEIAGNTLGLIGEVVNFYACFHPVMRIFLTPEQRDYPKKRLMEVAGSVQNTFKALKEMSGEKRLELIGEAVVDYLVLRRIGKIINPKIQTLLEAEVSEAKVARDVVSLGNTIEEIQAQNIRQIPNAQNIPANQLPKPPRGINVHPDVWKELIMDNKLVKEGHVIEAATGLKAAEQGAIDGPIKRSAVSVGSAPEDFFTITGEAIDVKSPVSFNKFNKNEVVFKLARFIDDIKADLAKGETILLNMASLHKKHLKILLKQILTDFDLQTRTNKFVLALSNKNFRDIPKLGYCLSKNGAFFKVINVDAPSTLIALNACKDRIENEQKSNCENMNSFDQDQFSKEAISSMTSAPSGFFNPKKSTSGKILSEYSQIPLSKLNISNLLASSKQTRNEEIKKVLLSFKGQGLSFKEYMEIKNREMSSLADKFLSGEKSSDIEFGACVKKNPESDKFTLKQAAKNYTTFDWERAWNESPELRKHSDEKIDCIIDCLLDSMESLSFKSINARLNLAQLDFPGGTIAEYLPRFKHDILPCFFEDNGDLRLNADVKTATNFTVKFLKSIAKDRNFFVRYLNRVKSHKNRVLSDLMEKEVNNIPEDLEFRPYEFQRNSLANRIGYRNMEFYKSVTNSSLNKDLEKLLNLSVDFVEARSIIEKYKGETKDFIKWVFGETYLKSYTKYGVLKKYENDSHYKKLTKKELEEISSSQLELDMLNTALWMRSKVGLTIIKKFGISNSASRATMNVVDKMIDHITKGTIDPLDELIESPNEESEETISSFFDEEGILKNISQEKRVGIIASEAKIPTGSSIPDKVINLFYQLGTRIEDADLRHLIFKYLVRHPEADAILQYNYRKIGVNAFGVCVGGAADGIKDIQKLKTLDFIKQYFDDKQVRNHHSLTFLAAEFFEALYNCGKGEGTILKKYVVLSCLDRLALLMHANNRIENSEKIEAQTLEMFKDFRLPTELYDVKKNTEHCKWLSDSLNNFDAKTLEQLIVKYDKI